MTIKSPTTLSKNTLVPAGVMVTLAVAAFWLGCSLTTLRADIRINSTSIGRNETNIGKLDEKLDMVLREIARLQGIKGVPPGRAGGEVGP